MLELLRESFGVDVNQGTKAREEAPQDPVLSLL